MTLGYTLWVLQKSVRWPDDVAEAIQARADATERTFSFVAIECARRMLLDGGVPAADGSGVSPVVEPVVPAKAVPVPAAPEKGMSEGLRRFARVRRA